MVPFFQKKGRFFSSSLVFPFLSGGILLIHGYRRIQNIFVSVDRHFLRGARYADIRYVERAVTYQRGAAQQARAVSKIKV